MRWLFWVLVLVNLAITLWATGIHQPADTARLYRPPVHGERMMLLETGTESPRPSHCQVLGPFATRDLAEPALAVATEAGVPAALRSEAEQQVEGYRVLVGPFKDAATAEAMHRRLATKGVQGHYVIRSGLSNAIALGFFSELAKAEQFLDELAAKGVKAEIRVRQQEGPLQWWLDLGPLVDDAAAEALRARDWGSGVTLTQHPCG
jgi:cell division septation protein DedD